MLVVPFPLAWIFLFLAVFCLFFNTGPSNTALANVTFPSVRATAFALNILVVHALGDAISPALMGNIADRVRATSGITDPAQANAHSLTFAFLLAGFAIVASGIVWLIGSRHLARDTELAPTRLAP